MDESEKEKFIKLLAERMAEQKRIHENSKYGQLIIQTNEVQFYLTLLVQLRSYAHNKKLRDYLEKLGLGNLINCFRICAKNSAELELADSLNKYKESRDALAHKMFTSQKLTIKECELSIELGEKLIMELKKLLRAEIA